MNVKSNISFLYKLLREIFGSLAAKCSTMFICYFLCLSAVWCLRGNIQFSGFIRAFVKGNKANENNETELKAVDLQTRKPKVSAERCENAA